MSFLPIVERELREGARRKSTRYVRLTVAAVALVISIFFMAFLPLLMGMSRTSGSSGFGLMTGYAFLLCLLAGVFVTADCLSEEKREGTLGLLFLTDLCGYDVVLGKLVSQLVYLGYALLAIIPAAALPMLFGGVTGGELWRISLALVNLLFFSLATGMFASALCRQAGQAMLLTGALLLLVCFISPIIQFIMDNFGPTGMKWFGWLSPAEAYSRAREATFFPQPNRFWVSLGVSHLFAWILIALASWRLPRSWQDKPIKPRSKPLAEFLNAGSGESKLRRRRELLDTAPLLWLIGERTGVRSLLWILAIGWSLLVVLVAILQVEALMPLLVVIGWLTAFLVKMLFASQACRFFAEARRMGSFELLLAAPITTQQLVSAQWASLRRTFGPPVLAAVGVSALCVVYWMILNPRGVDEAIPFISIFGSFGAGLQLLDILALGNIGMWLALTMRKPHLSTGASILFVLVLPLVGVWCAPFLGFILDIILIAVFLNKLQTNFRHVVLDRPGLSTDSSR